MKRIFLLTFFTVVLCIGTNAQDTFYKQYEFALENDDEDIHYLYTIDDTLRMISIRTVSTVGINFSLIDTNGEVISNTYHDDIFFFQEAILYDEEKEQFIFDGISRRDPPNKNCVFRLDKYGNIIESKCNEYALPDDNALGDVDNALHMTKTNFGYVSSGGEFTENGRYGFINIYDDDLNLTFSDTLSKFRYIGNIAYDGQGGINAIGLVQNSKPIPNHLDSMFFLKINSEGQITHQKRIPQTQNIPQSNGHYPFITDTLTGESYMFDMYDYDIVHGDLAIPRIVKFDQQGNIIWQFHDWQTRPRFFTGNLYLKHNGDLIAHGKAFLRDVTTNRSSDVAELVSIDSDGNFLWDRIFYDLVTIEDRIERRFLISRNITEDSKGSIYCGALGFLPIPGAGQDKPYLIKMTPEGCFTADCRTTVNLGDYHKPNNLVTERNEIHIYNKDTGQSYRYTFYRRDDIERGGELLKSNYMSGDEDWESIGRDFTGWGVGGASSKTYIREQFDPTDEYPAILSDWHYNFAYEVGDRLRLEHSFIARTDYLQVVAIEDVTLLDGRTKSKFTLECENLDPDGNSYPQRIWIEDIGDINDFLNTPFACSDPGNEVVTCFFSDGDLIWRHPDFDFCTVDTEDIPDSRKNVFPNPAHDFLKLDFEVRDYSIIDIYGQVHVSGQEVYIDDEVDVSLLASGTYIFMGTNGEGKNVRLRFVKI